MLTSLNSVAAIAGLPADRMDEVNRLVRSAGDYLNEAHSLYGSVLADPSSMAQKQGQIRSLAAHTEELKASLAKTKYLFSQDPHNQLAGAAQHSAS